MATAVAQHAPAPRPADGRLAGSPAPLTSVLSPGLDPLVALSPPPLRLWMERFRLFFFCPVRPPSRPSAEEEEEFLKPVEAKFVLFLLLGFSVSHMIA